MNSESSWERRFESRRQASHQINNDFFKALRRVFGREETTEENNMSEQDRSSIANDNGPQKLEMIERVANRRSE